MQRVLVVMPYAGASFMEEDVRLLRRHATVDTVVGASGWGTCAAVRRALRTARPDVVLQWFAHPTYAWAVTEFAHQARVPVAIVTGGYDVACQPEFRFGAMRKPHYRFLVQGALRTADVLLPFSTRAAGETTRWATPRAVRVVYPAVDPAVFAPPATAEPRAALALTVSKVNKLFLRQKGLDTFVAAARAVPEARFVIVGGAAGDDTLDTLRASAPPNLEFVTEFLSREMLVDLYRQARVYVQASAHEGFGLAAAEAMACGATVVGNGETALAEVVGDTGELVRYGDVDGTVAAIRRALAANVTGNTAAAQRIATHFSLEAREQRLVAILEALAAGRALPPPGVAPAPGRIAGEARV